MSKVVDFGAGYTCLFIISVYCGSDVSDQKRLACFGDKKCFIGCLLSDLIILFKCGFGGFIERNCAFASIFLRFYKKMSFFIVRAKKDIVCFKIGKFSDPDSGLEQNLDYGSNSGVIARCVTKSPIFDWCKNSGRFCVKSGMIYQACWIVGNKFLNFKVSEKSFSGI